MNKYTAREIKSIDTKPGCWNYLDIGIFEIDEAGNEKQIGQYRRNYSSFYQTFHPFKQGDQWYALYSKEYTATRVMRLPDCVDVCGEESNSYGFCPTGFYVPTEDDFSCIDFEDKENKFQAGHFGFVRGCIWGDDTSWKIQFLDLSKISTGTLHRDDRFGYVAMPNSIVNLKDCVDLNWFTEEDPIIGIATSKMLRLNQTVISEKEITADVNSLDQAIDSIKTYLQKLSLDSKLKIMIEVIEEGVRE